MAQPNRFPAFAVRIFLWFFVLFVTPGILVGNAQTIGRGQSSVTVTPNNSGIGEPGATIIYEHKVKNTGAQTDTYDITVNSSKGWTTLVTPDVLTLNPNQQMTILVTLVVGTNAQQGDVDVTTVKATSQAEPGTMGTATDTTTVPIPVFMPMVSNNAGEEAPDCQLVSPPVGNPPGVDLVVTAISFNPNPPAAGQQATVRVTVKNQGQTDVTAGNNFLIDFYDNPVPAPPGPFQPGVVYWGVQGVDFAAGESQTLVGSYAFTSGFHYLYAQIDTDGVVEESNEGNNVYGCLGLTVN